MRRFIECLIPLTSCNLQCSYCYIIQEGRRKNEKAILKYSPEVIGQALSQERLGGVSLISLTASGETFIFTELADVVLSILRQGHFVNLTTNGTLSKQMRNLFERTKEYNDHLHISFSFHYVELLKRKLVETFFDNINMARSYGCSILLQINLCDEYVPYWDEIKRISKERVGAYPQVALTRDEKDGDYQILTNTMTKEEYYQKGMEMKSPLFDFTFKNFMVKRTEYCYAGLWSAKLNIATGEMTGCYGLGIKQNIFENLNNPIRWRPIGKHCRFKYCFNSSHFLSQGNIPELLPIPSYGELRCREDADWYSPVMKKFLFEQFESTNPEISLSNKIRFEIERYTDSFKFRLSHLWK